MPISGENAKFIIVINSYQRALNLVRRSLNSALGQNPAPEKVFFIDQNNPPLEFSEEISLHPLFRHIPHRVPCVSQARNILRKIFATQTVQQPDWIVFCDDDGFLAGDYTLKFAELLRRTPAEIIAGSIVRDDNNEFYSPRHKMGGDLNKFRYSKILMGSNFAVKRETFEKLGGFDENFGAGSKWGSGEETDFAWKAYFNHVPMAFHPELIVYHIKPYAGDFSHSFKKAYRYGVGKGALVAKWIFKEKKLLVLYELLEMYIVPILLCFASFLTLNFKNGCIHFSTLVGRSQGLLLGAYRES